MFRSRIEQPARTVVRCTRDALRKREGARSRSAAALAAAALGLLATASCGDGGLQPVEPGTPGIQVVSGQDVVDTVGSFVAEPLLIEVRGPDGLPAVGAAVRFESPFGDYLRLAPEKNGPFNVTSVLTTDRDGRAPAYLWLGTRAGAMPVSMVVPELGYRDTAHIPIRPGNPTRVGFEPKDTAVYVGGSYTLRAYTQDRWGNRRTDTITYEAVSAEVAVGATGVVTGSSIGRARMLARHGELTDTGWVSVVPRGTLSVVREGHVVLIGLDGCGYTELVDLPYHQGITPGDWSADGRTLVLGAGMPEPRLVKVSLDGVLERVIPAGATAAERELWPQFSPDGQWIYYSAEVGRIYPEVWRVRSDGTDAERLSLPLLDVHDADWTPTPSPDGTRIAYGTDRYGPPWRLDIMDLSTRAVTTLPVGGVAARWSPAGDLIAYVDPNAFELYVVRPDGTQPRRLGIPGRRYSWSYGLDWSPDGAWIAAGTSTAGIDVVEVATGLALPLAFTVNRFTQPAWRPEGSD